MSEASSGPKREPPGWSRSLPPGILRAGDRLVRHTILLQRCFDGTQMRWSDALVARMRRHAGGCISAAEMALRLEIERRDTRIGQYVAALPEACCWNLIERHPPLIDPVLLAHFRDRAALSLMRQESSFSDPEAVAGREDKALFPPMVIETLTTITLAQSGWADGGPDDVPMRLDIPAEVMAELVWTACSIIADALIRTSGLPKAEVLETVQAAGWAVLGRHDEQTGPFAMSALFAHQLRVMGLTEQQLLHLAREGHVLPLLAILGDRIGVELLDLVRVVVEDAEQALFTLCRAADMPREVAVRLVLGRRSVARGVDDSMLVQYADEYDLKAPDAARESVAELAMPQPLRDKLSLLHDWMTDEC